MSASTASPSILTETITQPNGKRKRVVSPEHGHGTIKKNHAQDNHLEEFHVLLKDILVILRRLVQLSYFRLSTHDNPTHYTDVLLPLTLLSLYSYDTTPSILHYPITLAVDQGHATKRTKLTEPTTKPTISSRIESNAYAAIQDFAADVEEAVTSVTADLSDHGDRNDPQIFPANVRQNQAELVRITAFQKELNNVMLREMVQRPELLRKGIENSLNLDGKEAIKERKTKPGWNPSENYTGGIVLTLFGGAPQPKQLFSSLQQPVPSKSELKQEGSFSNRPDNYIEPLIYAPLRELALPNGISTTRIIPIHSTSSSESNKVPSIGELFAPPHTLAPLNPPRQSKHTATRSSSVNWFNATEAPASGKSHRKESYTNQPLTTPHWLTYNIVPPPKELTSPEAKRKQRDRALSIGETQGTLSQEAIAEHQQAKEDALFRSAYSSFAPDRDNSAALVSERTKNKIWWNRTGETKYQMLSTLQNDGALGTSEDNTVDYKVDEIALFKEAVDDWKPEDLPSEMKGPGNGSGETAEAAKDVDEILQGISELLETLNSHQRVRNLTLSSNTRTIAGTNAQSNTSSGSPSSPSAAEFDVYDMLKSQLTVMVQMLPPHALAKLDGDKLGVLNVNTQIQIEGKNYKGSMDEDEITSRAKLGANAGYAARSLNATTSLPARSTGYHQSTTPLPASRSTYTPQTTFPRPAPGSTTHLPNQQYSSRPASTNHHFSGNSRSSYPQQRPAMSASERYSYGTAQHYTPQPSQTTQSQYSNGYRQYSAANGSSYSQQYSSPQRGGSSAANQTPQQRPSQPSYQQRAMNSQGYGHPPVAAGRSASPPKASSAYSPPQQQLAAYPAQSATPSQQRPQLYHQHSSQFGGQSSTSVHTNGTDPVASDSQRTRMTANEQATLMNRQKAQLAEQQTPPAIHGSATPQPTKGMYSSQQNGSVTVQQNGVVAGQV